MGNINPKNRVIYIKLPYLIPYYRISSVQPWAKANGKGTALKGQRPYPEKEKAAYPCAHSLRNNQPNRPYAVPLPSAALR